MEFLIERTSGYFNSTKQPTEGAYKRGKKWYIKINSLEELIKLSEKEGQIIIEGDYLEIYDDYRE